jgi:hypothetical protein
MSLIARLPLGRIQVFGREQDQAEMLNSIVGEMRHDALRWIGKNEGDFGLRVKASTEDPKRIGTLDREAHQRRRVSEFLRTTSEYFAKTRLAQ